MTVVLKRDRIEYWKSVGAQPSDIVAKLLAKTPVAEATPEAAAA